MSFPLILTVLALLCLFTVRNALVFHVRMKAINIIYHEVAPTVDYTKLAQEKLEGKNNYHAQTLDLRKWTFKQFFGDL